MRILHTADWHLKHRHKYSQMCDNGIWDRMFEEKMKVLNQIPKIAKEYDADIVCIAGDVFDSTNPIEPIKKRFAELIKKFDIPTYIIAGNHDSVSTTNYALMDLAEAFKGTITLIGPGSMSVQDGIGMFHFMMDSIDDHYKNTIHYDDEMFSNYDIVLLGDYHSFFRRKYGNKLFTYSGTPYPTRFDEDNHSVSLIDTTTQKISVVKLKSFKLVEYAVEFGADKLTGSLKELDNGESVVVKITVTCKGSDLNEVKHIMNTYKDRLCKIDNCIDLVYFIKTGNTSKLDRTQGRTIHSIAYDFIDSNCKYPKSAKKRYNSILAGGV